jgi:hypothetical protein
VTFVPSQDYSVKISNPPMDAINPDEWHKFFKENLDAHATVVTVAVDNDLLVKTLVERRERLRRINLMQESGASMKLLDLARVCKCITWIPSAAREDAN